MPGRRDEGSGLASRKAVASALDRPSEARVRRGREAAGRFLFYSHDGLGLGHVRRNLCVANALAELAPRASVLVATSAEEVERFGTPPRVDFLKLPGLRKIDNGHYAARRLGLSWEDVRSLRANLLAAAVYSFRPTVILADRHPLGVCGELEHALEAARESGARTALGLRDVLDEPDAVRAEWEAHGVFERIDELYDRVLICGQPDVFDPSRVYSFPGRVAAITRFCGYVVAPAEGLRPSRGQSDPFWAGDGRPRVLAAAGGGEDGFTLLETFIEAAAGMPWKSAVVSGPQCEPERARRLRALAEDAGVAFRRFVPALASHFPSVDALVSMGGYNTLTEAAASGVSTVCVPRVHPRREQLIRARAFARRGLVKLLPPANLAADSLRVAVGAALDDRRGNGRRVRPLDVAGARRAALHLLELASDASVDRRPAVLWGG
jgi:predicted glycosyltransferase